ncbi:hypothetical protein C8J56DRAFT_1020888 [Mycena floridula]|nr:hypothetical protein C8J56DRAFT_1020888 [Mycena floridula]
MHLWSVSATMFSMSMPQLVGTRQPIVMTWIGDEAGSREYTISLFFADGTGPLPGFRSPIIPAGPGNGSVTIDSLQVASGTYYLEGEDGHSVSQDVDPSSAGTTTSKSTKTGESSSTQFRESSLTGTESSQRSTSTGSGAQSLLTSGDVSSAITESSNSSLVQDPRNTSPFEIRTSTKNPSVFNRKTNQFHATQSPVAQPAESSVAPAVSPLASTDPSTHLREENQMLREALDVAMASRQPEQRDSWALTEPPPYPASINVEGLHRETLKPDKARQKLGFNSAQGKGENKCKAEQAKEKRNNKVKTVQGKGKNQLEESMAVRNREEAVRCTEATRNGVRVRQQKEKVREKAAQRKPSMKKAKKE